VLTTLCSLVLCSQSVLGLLVPVLLCLKMKRRCARASVLLLQTQSHRRRLVPGPSSRLLYCKPPWCYACAVLRLSLLLLVSECKPPWCNSYACSVSGVVFPPLALLGGAMNAVAYHPGQSCVIGDLLLDLWCLLHIPWWVKCERRVSIPRALWVFFRQIGHVNNQLRRTAQV
jgi:hypothetical protein